MTFPPEIFPNAMVDRIGEIAQEKPVRRQAARPPSGDPDIVVEVPPGKIYFHVDRWESEEAPPSVEACPTGFLRWTGSGMEACEDARCIGCLMCETAALLEGSGEISIHLEMPEEVD
jgi:hypothetical protein